MALRDKTNQRFKEFFEKQFKKNEGKEFEIPFSEIQRETGAASSTMKRAIEALVEEEWLEIKPGRNTRYALFKLKQEQAEEKVAGNEVTKINLESSSVPPTYESDLETSAPASVIDSDKISLFHSYESKMKELEHLMDGLRRRVRAQEMTIALLQDRMAEIEDKLYRK